MPKSAPNDLPAFTVCTFSHTAGVYDADVRWFINPNDLVSLVAELTGYGRGFGKIQFAAEGMDSHFSHRYEKELPDERGQLFP
jgi:hypothetical protein